jgi:hypothetical protein
MAIGGHRMKFGLIALRRGETSAERCGMGVAVKRESEDKCEAQEGPRPPLRH